VGGVFYVANEHSDTVSVIDRFSGKVATGVTLNVNPGNSGKVICDKKEYPTNIYLYVDAGTKCTAQNNNGFEFSGWVENRNRNSTIPLDDSSGNLTVNRYGTFTANFKPLPPTIPPQYSFLVVSVIVSSIIGWSIPSIIGLVRAKRQRKYLKECMNQIGKIDKNAIEKMITGYYVEGKISQDHRQLLKDKIAEYYNNTNGSYGSHTK
jgi:YVTN family beta-propeller protein